MTRCEFCHGLWWKKHDCAEENPCYVCGAFLCKKDEIECPVLSHPDPDPVCRGCRVVCTGCATHVCKRDFLGPFCRDCHDILNATDKDGGYRDENGTFGGDRDRFKSAKNELLRTLVAQDKRQTRVTQYFKR